MSLSKLESTFIPKNILMASNKSIALRRFCLIGYVLVIALLMNGVSSSSSGGRKLCGRTLIQTLDLLCATSGFYGPSKKDVGVDDDYYQINQELEIPEYPFMSRMQGTEMKSLSFRRIRRGIVDECCLKACSRNELLSYCVSN